MGRCTEPNRLSRREQRDASATGHVRMYSVDYMYVGSYCWYIFCAELRFPQSADLSCLARRLQDAAGVARGERERRREGGGDALNGVLVERRHRLRVALAGEGGALDALHHLAHARVQLRVVDAQLDGRRLGVATEAEHLGRQTVELIAHLRIGLQPPDDLTTHGRLEAAPARTKQQKRASVGAYSACDAGKQTSRPINLPTTPLVVIAASFARSPVV